MSSSGAAPTPVRGAGAAPTPVLGAGAAPTPVLGAGAAPTPVLGEARKAWRSTEDDMIGGVASGLAVHLGLPVMWVRVTFILLAVMGGFGAVLYAGLWLVLPSQPHFEQSAPGLAAATRQGKRPRRTRRFADYGPLIALGAVALGSVALFSAVTGRAVNLWPVFLGVAGVAVLWRQADEVQRDRWVDSSGRVSILRAFVGGGGWASYVRIVVGIATIVGAITLFTVQSGGWSEAGNAAVAALLGVVGLAFILGPWLIRLVTDLGEERAERVRSQERADVAAHLHDSVLQTLALIQKSAHDPSAVARLARSQERDLRSWLFDSEAADSTTLAASLRAVAGEVDDAHGVPVEVVCVGDLPITEPLRPLVLATREAVVNAARHSGAGRVDVYAEITAAEVAIFVRDRGAGFDPETIATDRHGVRDSIVDRMRRHGGDAVVKSTVGSGTEVRLTLPIEQRVKESR